MTPSEARFEMQTMRYPVQDSLMSLAVYFSWKIVLTCKPAVLHTSPHDGTAWVSSPHRIFQKCKHFKTIKGFHAKYITHYAFTALLIGKKKNICEDELPSPGWAALSLSPFHHPLVSLMLRCLSPVKAWQGPDRLPLKGPSVISDIRYQ